MESRHSSKLAHNIQNTKKRLRCAICKYQYVVGKAQMCEFEALTLGMIAKFSLLCSFVKELGQYIVEDDI